MIVVLGKESCTECQRTKMILKARNINYEYIDIEKDIAEETRGEFINNYTTKGFKSFPFIEVNGVAAKNAFEALEIINRG